MVKHNNIVEAGYRLSINENRVLLTCISQIDSMGVINSDDKFIVTVQDLIDLIGLDTKNTYKQLELAAKRLYSRSVSINLPDNRLLETRWVSSIEYIPNSGSVELQFSQKIIPYISELRREFTQYRLNNILMFKSNYSIRIYELLVKWDGNTKVVEVDWLKKKFQIEDKYKNIGDLKRKVIDIAITEINQHSDMTVAYTQIKRGRNIVAFKFEYSLKKDKKPKKEKTWHGIPETEVDKLARVGESYPEAGKRIASLKQALGKKS